MKIRIDTKTKWDKNILSLTLSLLTTLEGQLIILESFQAFDCLIKSLNLNQNASFVIKGDWCRLRPILGVSG